jgi:hypothetical protein
MLRHFFVLFLFVGQVAFGQGKVLGDYRGALLTFDSIWYTIHLCLKEGGRYTMDYSRGDCTITSNGKWRSKGDKIRFKPAHSKIIRFNQINSVFFLTVEAGDLIDKEKLSANTERRIERMIRRNTGEKVTLEALKPQALVLHKEN